MKRYNLLIGALALVMLSCRGGKSNAQSGLLSTNETTKAKVVTMYELPAPLKDRPEQILYKTGFTISYNAETKNPNWVAWHLTDAHTNGPHQRKQEIFSEDLSVKSPRATNNDYYNSRYDRGHMCPAGDNKWSSESMRESFLFTNICPQNHNLNGGDWRALEELARDWARKYNEIFITCGPIVANPYETIGKYSKIAVPSAFYKVFLRKTSNSWTSIGFVFPNAAGHRPLMTYMTTVDEVEKLTGIDFFYQLPDSVENIIESDFTVSDWNL